MDSATLLPGQATFLRDFLLPQLTAEHAVTCRIVAAIPADQVDYRPHPKAMPALALAGHLALCELWFLDAVIDRVFRDADAPTEVRTGPEMTAWYAERFAARLPSLAALTDDALATPVNYLDLRRDPAVAYLNIAIRHSVHHRGQLSAYLRAMGAVVPAIYVESADEPYPAAGDSRPAQPPPAF